MPVAVYCSLNVRFSLESRWFVEMSWIIFLTEGRMENFALFFPGFCWLRVWLWLAEPLLLSLPLEWHSVPGRWRLMLHVDVALDFTRITPSTPPQSQPHIHLFCFTLADVSILFSSVKLPLIIGMAPVLSKILRSSRAHPNSIGSPHHMVWIHCLLHSNYIFMNSS